jgi:uncharacterized membrane protein
VLGLVGRAAVLGQAAGLVVVVGPALVGLAVAVGLEGALALAEGLTQTGEPALAAELAQSARSAARWVRADGGGGQLAVVASG